MSQADVQRLLGKMILDEGFKAELKAEPKETMLRLGANLSDEEQRFIELIYELEETNSKAFTKAKDDKAKDDKDKELDDIDQLFSEIIDRKSKISSETICQIHKAIFTADTLGEAGKFRKKSAYLREVNVIECQIKIEPISERLPDAKKVDFLISEFCQWLNSELEKGQNDPILLAAIAKHKFVCIHPFADGNGRVGRILVNLILKWFHLPQIPISVLMKEKREEYYKVLKLADEGNLQSLRSFIEENMLVLE